MILSCLNVHPRVRYKPCSVDSNFEEYVESIKTTVEDLTKALYTFDTITGNKQPFCTRPKVHYLHHLHEDIRRFGCALLFETEKGEMDVAICFGKQDLLKQVVDGGSWLNKKGNRVRYGSGLKEFLDRNGETFRLQFFGARE
ncbi:unnamed protein product [Mucor hiemalis]